jgi:hypothetical protein
MMKHKVDVIGRDFKIILPVAEQAIIDSASRHMAKRFGGVTMMPMVRGLWVSTKGQTKGELVKDDNIMLFSSRALSDIPPEKRKVQLLRDRQFMEHLAKKYGKLLKQQAIWTEEDLVHVEFIEPRKRLEKLI